MATMYALLFGLLLNAVCSVKGSSNSDVKHQTFLLAQAASGSYFFSAKKYAKNSSLKTFDTKEMPPPAIVKNFVGDTESECRDNDSFNSKLEKDELQSVFLRISQARPIERADASSSLQARLMSPVKLLTIAQGGSSLQSKGSSDEFSFAELHCVPVFASFFEENDEVLIHSFENKHLLDKKEEPRHGLSGIKINKGYGLSGLKRMNFGYEDKRIKILDIASTELGVREATNNNDGPRVEQYLRYTNLGAGYEWCAAFVSWCYGQAGRREPRNPWSPALFPNTRKYHAAESVQPADIFGIYGAPAKRINHVGLVKSKQGDYILTIEGNSNNRVESRRRHIRTIYAFSNWLSNNG